MTDRPHATEATSRINALIFRVLDGYMHWTYRERKRALFADLPDTVVELGAGVGANFRYLRPGTRVIAYEPNAHMHAGLHRAAEAHRIDLDLRPTGAEQLDLADDSVYAVICSLVLCTVPQPERVLAEVRRVLRPNGSFACIEHVAAPEGTVVRRIQELTFRPWRAFFEGCHNHRETGETIEHAGFREVEIERFAWRGPFIPVRPQIMVRARA